MTSCCTPDRTTGNGDRAVFDKQARRAGAPQNDIVDIPGGVALIGTDTPYLAEDGEAPLRRKKVAAFRIEATTVTQAQFEIFVDATGYQTDAERLGDALVFQGLLPKGHPPTRAVAEAPWWRVCVGANWRRPTGPDGPAPPDDHPVVQVSWNDAVAYAHWAGGQLPTEAEWEHAARAGQGDVPFPWGQQEPDDNDHQPCNIWQGHFPQHDLGLDGHIGTAPAKSFAPNGYGLFNMIGNVWEMTSEPFKVRSLRKAASNVNAARKGHKLSKGGSFLCHRSYCYRYRIAARNSTSADTATSHLGFRLAYRAR